MRLINLLFAPAAAYQVLAAVTAIRYARRASSRRRAASNEQPPISVLKPVRGVDPNTFEAFVSQAEQQYPEFEILFGVRHADDPVITEIKRLQGRFPQVAIRLVHTGTDALNAQVGTLIELGRQARYDIWVVNDGDIKVGREYLTTLAAQLKDPTVGLVTCPYRAWAHSAATNWEALGIAVDFMPGVLVADLLGVRDYGLGATLAFRKADFERVGGFEAIADYIADDYQIGHRLAKSGKPTKLCPYTVETALGEDTWAGVWQHQLRWSRTIRASKPTSHLGVPIAQAGLWIAIACLAGAWPAAVALLFLRWCSALLGTWAFENTKALRFFWLAPLWDLFSAAVWAATYAGTTVRWRDRVLRIGRDGRIVS